MDDNKLNLVLSELKNICNKIEEKFTQVDENFVRINKRFEQIESRFDKFEEKNETEHKTMFNMINSLTTSFLKFEAEQTTKINYLLESDKEIKEHQIIYAHQFTYLNDLVSKNSFRISNLEKKQSEN